MLLPNRILEKWKFCIDQAIRKIGKKEKERRKTVFHKRSLLKRWPTQQLVFTLPKQTLTGQTKIRKYHHILHSMNTSPHMLRYVYMFAYKRVCYDCVSVSLSIKEIKTKKLNRMPKVFPGIMKSLFMVVSFRLLILKDSVKNSHSVS